MFKLHYTRVNIIRNFTVNYKQRNIVMQYINTYCTIYACTLKDYK